MFAQLLLLMSRNSFHMERMELFSIAKGMVTMSKMSTVKQLKYLMFNSFGMLAISIFWLITNLAADRPMWLIVPSFVTTPAFLVIIGCILYDLNSNDRLTFEGKLIERIQLHNGWKFRVHQMGEEEKTRTFRMNEQFDDTFLAIEIGEPISVTYFMLTKGVLTLGKPEIADENSLEQELS